MALLRSCARSCAPARAPAPLRAFPRSCARSHAPVRAPALLRALLRSCARWFFTGFSLANLPKLAFRRDDTHIFVFFVVSRVTVVKKS